MSIKKLDSKNRIIQSAAKRAVCGTYIMQARTLEKNKTINTNKILILSDDKKAAYKIKMEIGNMYDIHICYKSKNIVKKITAYVLNSRICRILTYFN